MLPRWGELTGDPDSPERQPSVPALGPGKRRGPRPPGGVPPAHSPAALLRVGVASPPLLLPWGGVRSVLGTSNSGQAPATQSPPDGGTEYLPFLRSAPSTLGSGQAICFLGITRRPRRPHRGRLNPADGQSVARDLALRPWPLEAHFLFCAPESLLLGGTGGPSRTQNAVPKSSPFPWREAPGSGGPQSPGQPNSGAPRLAFPHHFLLWPAG